jgi:hypothetical protein
MNPLCLLRTHTHTYTRARAEPIVNRLSCANVIFNMGKRLLGPSSIGTSSSSWLGDVDPNA